jgi:anion-transporting  ArsA/GET3 family ATPase
MQAMFDDFGERFLRVSQLLTSAETAFLLVTSPEHTVLMEAEELHQGLTQMGITLKAVVVNRVHDEWLAVSPPATESRRLIERLRSLLQLSAEQKPLAEWLVKNFFTYQQIAREELARLTQFADTFAIVPPLVRIPALPAFPADLAGLAMMHRYLFSSQTGRSQRWRSKKR